MIIPRPLSYIGSCRRPPNHYCRALVEEDDDCDSADCGFEMLPIPIDSSPSPTESVVANDGGVPIAYDIATHPDLTESAIMTFSTSNMINAFLHLTPEHVAILCDTEVDPTDRTNAGRSLEETNTTNDLRYMVARFVRQNEQLEEERKTLRRLLEEQMSRHEPDRKGCHHEIRSITYGPESTLAALGENMQTVQWHFETGLQNLGHQMAESQASARMLKQNEFTMSDLEFALEPVRNECSHEGAKIRAEIHELHQRLFQNTDSLSQGMVKP